MRCVVVVEGKRDAEIAERLLANWPVEVRAASGRSAADSMARTILASGQRVVALIVDADTTKEDRAEELKTWLIESLGMMAPRDRFLVCVMVPEFEAIFFRDRAALEEALGHQLSSEQSVRAQFEPRRVLDELLGEQRPTQLLTQALVEVLRQHPAIQGILDFLSRHATHEAGSDAA